MARTTSDAVSNIIEVDVNISLTPFIEVANELVTECCADQGYTDTRLELIERWLSAHFYAIRDPRASQEKAGEVAAAYQTKVDLGLNQTTYGQQAMQLDTKGGLAALNRTTVEGKKRVASIKWLGTPLDEQ